MIRNGMLNEDFVVKHESWDQKNEYLYVCYGMFMGIVTNHKNGNIQTIRVDID